MLIATAVFAIWLAALVWSIIAVFRAVQTGTETQLSAQQTTVAVEAARSIEDHFRSLEANLFVLAGDPHIVFLDSEGRDTMQRAFGLSSGEYQSVTRMDATGKILYTYPIVSSIGADMRDQAHIQRLLATHAPVLSEVFTAVQGYRSLALHVPVFKDGSFDGSVGVLIPFDYIAEHFLALLPISRSGYAWVVSNEGVELFGPIPGYIGRSIARSPTLSEGEQSLVRAMMSGRYGFAAFASDHAVSRAGVAHASYMPIHIIDTSWSIAVEAPENEMLALMKGFLGTGIPAVFILILGIGAVLFMLFKNALSRREQRSKEIAEARYRSLVEQLPGINYTVKVGGPPGSGTTYISPQVQTILGFSPEEWLADKELWMRQLHPDDKKRVIAQVMQENLEGVPLDLEYRVLTKTGEIRWLHNRRAYTRDASGRIIGLTGVMLDITEKKNALEALRASEESYHTLIETTPLAVVVCDMTGTIVICNLQALSLGGIARKEDLIGTSIFSGVFAADKGRAEEDLRKIRETGSVRNVRYTLIRNGGTAYEAELNASLVVDEQGRPRYAIMVIQDVTERLAAEHALHDREEKLRQAQKLEAIGRLAGGVAHDFNNMLTVIRGYADSLVDAPDLSVSVRQDIQEILSASLRAQALTDQLLAYSRKQMRSPQMLDIGSLVTRMELMLGRLIGENIALRVSLAPALPSVLADPGQIEQVIMNLALNARDAMPEGGILSIAARALTLEAPDIVRPLVPAGRYLVLSIKDSGIGMDAEVLSHIFEPFFTTKEMGKGTGLGLSTVYGIVKQSGGFVFADSAMDRGTLFEIFLPATDEKPKSVTLVPAAKAPPMDSGRILLVEDEDTVRTLARTILTRSGYTVLEARNGREALATCIALGGTLDLLVTDVVMPDMGGIELGRQIGKLFPVLRVLYMSGYTDDEPGLLVLLERGSPFLRKPFNATELSMKVREVLAGGVLGPQGLEPRTNGL